MDKITGKKYKGKLTERLQLHRQNSTGSKVSSRTQSPAPSIERLHLRGDFFSGDNISRATTPDSRLEEDQIKLRGYYRGHGSKGYAAPSIQNRHLQVESNSPRDSIRTGVSTHSYFIPPSGLRSLGYESQPQVMEGMISTEATTLVDTVSEISLDEFMPAPLRLPTRITPRQTVNLELVVDTPRKDSNVLGEYFMPRPKPNLQPPVDPFFNSRSHTSHSTHTDRSSHSTRGTLFRSSNWDTGCDSELQTLSASESRIGSPTGLETNPFDVNTKTNKGLGSSYRHSILKDRIAALTYDAGKYPESFETDHAVKSLVYDDHLLYESKHKTGYKAPRKWYGRWSTREIILLIMGSILFLALVVAVTLTLWNEKHGYHNPGLIPTWRPAIGTTWQIQIDVPLTSINSQARVYDIDLFNNSADTISQLHHIGRRVICYFSAGTYEGWRPDADLFDSSELGTPVPGFPDQRWLDIRSQRVRNIMAARVQLAVEKGCDGIDPDHVNGYSFTNTSFPLTVADGVSYVRYLARLAHGADIAVGLKNSPELINKTLDVLDWGINESCAKSNNCVQYQPFIQAGKPLFHIEYGDNGTVPVLKEACNAPGTHGFSTLIKKSELSYWSMICPFGDPVYSID